MQVRVSRVYFNIVLWLWKVFIPELVGQVRGMGKGSVQQKLIPT
jgi:hypothetical protein